MECGPEGTFSHMAARHLFGLAARYREAIQGYRTHLFYNELMKRTGER